MRPPIRLGAVDYLNARPLVCGLPDPPGLRPDPAVTVRFDLPAVCATLLADGEIDLGLIPTIAYLVQPTYRVVPDIGIVSDGPVASVAIFTRKPMGEVRSLALDTSSRTSVALARVLCARVFAIAPSFVPHPPQLDAMLTSCDAALLIGDPALFADYRALGADKLDLGQAWTDWTGLPFVWAFWSGRAGTVDAAVVQRLQTARDEGVAGSDGIADAYCPGDPMRQAIARRYLREHIKYQMCDRALEGLRTFFREAQAMGVVESHGPIRFF